jgi:hypothetical protein
MLHIRLPKILINLFLLILNLLLFDIDRALLSDFDIITQLRLDHLDLGFIVLHKLHLFS